MIAETFRYFYVVFKTVDNYCNCTSSIGLLLLIFFFFWVWYCTFLTDAFHHGNCWLRLSLMTYTVIIVHFCIDYDRRQCGFFFLLCFYFVLRCEADDNVSVHPEKYRYWKHIKSSLSRLSAHLCLHYSEIKMTNAIRIWKTK